MMTTLTVCGSAGSYPGPGRACSSYLLRGRHDTFVLDIGSGSLANLQRWVSLSDVTHIFASHDHVDHVADLIGLLQFTSFGRVRSDHAVHVYAHESTCNSLRDMQRRHAAQDRSLTLHPVAPGHEYGVGADFSFTVYPALHSRPALSIRVVDDEGSVVAYTGDTALTDDVVECARGADVLVAEASWLQPEEQYPAGLHMTADDAGRLAVRADVAAVLVTHVWPEFDPQAVGARVRARYSGRVWVAEDNLTVPLRAARR